MAFYRFQLKKPFNSMFIVVGSIGKPTVSPTPSPSNSPSVSPTVVSFKLIDFVDMGLLCMTFHLMSNNSTFIASSALRYQKLTIPSVLRRVIRKCQNIAHIHLVLSFHSTLDSSRFCTF